MKLVLAHLRETLEPGWSGYCRVGRGSPLKWVDLAGLAGWSVVRRMLGVEPEHRRFGMISVKDRRLLQEALDWRCDAFLTMERRLPTAAAFIAHETGLRVMRPTTYWDLLDPWANIYY